MVSRIVLSRTLAFARLFLAGLMLVLSACAGGPRYAPVSPPPESTPAIPPASASSGLVTEARAARGKGDYLRAGDLLQRALRIDSRNANIYLELARLQADQGEAEAAVTFAERGLLYCRPAVCEELRQLL